MTFYSTHQRFQLDFDHSDIFDRTPVMPGQGRVIFAGVGEFVFAGGAATVTIGRARYPEVPPDFRLNPDAETLWLRYQAYLDGMEPLPVSGGVSCPPCSKDPTGFTAPS